jgi:hypothetical protein
MTDAYVRRLSVGTLLSSANLDSMRITAQAHNKYITAQITPHNRGAFFVAQTYSQQQQQQQQQHSNNTATTQQHSNINININNHIQQSQFHRSEPFSGE